MAYDYIWNFYGVKMTPGERVRHTITNREGLVMEPDGNEHYVRVHFDGSEPGSYCHPLELMGAGNA